MMTWRNADKALGILHQMKVVSLTLLATLVLVLCPLDSWLDEPHNQMDEEKNIPALARNRTPVIQPVASHFID
jgi:hypothetical protein